MPNINQPRPPMTPKQRDMLALKIGCGIFAGLVVLVVLIAVIGTISYANSHASSDVSQPTPTPQTTTDQFTQVTSDTPTSQPTLTPIPSAHDLDTLLSSYGHVTNVSAPTLDANGMQDVAIDVQVDNPTQSRVKHLAFELAQFFYQRSDIGLINLAFHANGYTGPDDPIAGCGGLAPTGWTGMDESHLWDAMTGVFDANLPA